MKRDLTRFESSRFDVLVIGAGVLGACIARDAALRGLAVAVIDAADFGGATSANSLRIIHGGLRYLQHLDLRRVQASIRERSTWLRIAPHLVEPLPILVPTYDTGRQRRTLLRLALALNDAIGRKRNLGLAPDRTLPVSRIVTRDECVRLVPELASSRLTGGALFHDAQMYSAERLTFALVHDAHQAGAAVANYVTCTAPLREARRLAGVEAVDALSGARLAIRASLVINAAGPATGEIAARLVGRSTDASTPYSSAVNVQLPPLGHAVAFSLVDGPQAGLPPRGQQLFMAPWRGSTLVGTGHFPLSEGTADAAAERLTLDFLAMLNRAWPGQPFDVGDITAVNTGLLPVARAGGIRLLRRHRIIDHASDGEPNLISAVSVKYTTARLVAEEVIDRAVRRIGGARPCLTATTPLASAADSPPVAAAGLELGGGLDAEARAHLERCYGAGWRDVVTRNRDVPGWSQRVEPGLPVIRAQLVHAVRYEMANTVDDLVLRRTELGARGRASAAARAAAESVLEQLGRTDAAERLASDHPAADVAGRTSQ